VRFRILGPLEIWTGQGWSGIGAPKWRALLAALLLNPGQVISTERLIAELWDEEPPSGAANLVSVYVLRVRRLIGDRGGEVLATRAPGYQLRLEPGDLDAAAFEALTRQGRAALAGGDAPRGAGLLTEALALWRGDALSDIPQSGLVTAEADRLSESRLTALELRITAELDCGLPSELVPELRRLISDNPLREGLWLLLMQALDRAGRRAESVAAFSEARQVIADELGVDPGPALRQLYQWLLTADTGAGPGSAAGSIRASSTMTGPAGGPDAAGPDSGRPDARAVPPSGEQSVPPAAATASSAGSIAPAGPATRAARSMGLADDQGAAGLAGRPAVGTDAGIPDGTPAPAQLPADLADFTGRAEHLARLHGLLSPAPGTARPAAMAVAVVAGTPGLGKTALAVHAAHELRAGFPDGQLYVSLLGASEQPVVPGEILARLLRDLGVNPDQIPAGQEERAALYRTRLADRRVLIVLDDARDAAQVRPLLPGSATCAVIVTSRHRLSDLAASRLVDLDVLDDSEARGLLTAIIGDERAAAEPGPVREVLDACAGLPLAIRIAGARLTARRGWAVKTLARRLADQHRRVAELTAGDMAVRACFDVSFESLKHLATGQGVDPAHAFRLLGIWQGPHISLPAAAALLGQPEDDVADALEVLVDAHLLESPAPEVYKFHDLLRAYAAERAMAQEPADAVAEAVSRLLWWYLRTADAAATVVTRNRERVPLGAGGPPGGALEFATAEEALEWSAGERAGLVAATRQAAAADLHDVAWKLPVAVLVCFDRHGYRAEWIATHQVALDSARRIGDRHGEAWVLNNLGMVHSQLRTPDALSYLGQALAIHRERGDRQGQAQVTNNIAFDYQIRGMHEAALPALADALELQRQVGHRYGEGVALSNFGEAYVELGRHEEAIASLQEALPIVRETGSTRVEAYILCNLGRSHLDLGQAADGATLLEQALAIHRTERDKYGQAAALKYLGQARFQAGQADAARAAWEEAVRLLEALSDDKQAAVLRTRLEELGDSGRDRGQQEPAIGDLHTIP
jgi:DNA-binding SARP family transcriptional activator/predicted negative regulator of RcsB-dependent stress response